MSVSKDEAMGTWTIYSRYTNWQNKTKVLHKRGFKQSERHWSMSESSYFRSLRISIWALQNS